MRSGVEPDIVFARGQCVRWYATGRFDDDHASDLKKIPWFG
jgi:hypothetical protein